MKNCLTAKRNVAGMFLNFNSSSIHCLSDVSSIKLLRLRGEKYAISRCEPCRVRNRHTFDRRPTRFFFHRNFGLFFSSHARFKCSLRKVEMKFQRWSVVRCQSGNLVIFQNEKISFVSLFLRHPWIIFWWRENNIPGGGKLRCRYTNNKIFCIGKLIIWIRTIRRPLILLRKLSSIRAHGLSSKNEQIAYKYLQHYEKKKNKKKPPWDTTHR